MKEKCYKCTYRRYEKQLTNGYKKWEKSMFLFENVVVGHYTF